MVNDMVDTLEIQKGRTAMTRLRRAAWILILVSDAGFLAWGAMAALLPQYLPGPGGTPILTAGYEGFTHSSWSGLVAASPATADFITLVFRLFGALCATFGLVGVFIAATAFRRGERWAWWALLIGNTIAYGAPMTYDRLVNAIGMFEMSEYLGIALIYLSLAATVPLLWGGSRLYHPVASDFKYRKYQQKEYSNGTN